MSTTNLSKQQIEVDEMWGELTYPKKTSSGLWCCNCENELPFRHVVPPVPKEHRVCPDCKEAHKAAQLTKQERQEIFLKDPEVQKMLEGKIKEDEQTIKDYEEIIDDAYKQDISGTLEEWARESVIEHAEFEIENCKRNIKSNRRMLAKAKGEYIEVKDSFDIDVIKESVLISELMGESPQFKSTQRSKYKCPLHDEDSASFVVYHEQNSFYCFGCNEGGSVIDLHMKLNNLDFITACKELNKSYL